MQDPVRKAMTAEPSVQLTCSPSSQAVQLLAAGIANCADTPTYTDEHHGDMHKREATSLYELRREHEDYDHYAAWLDKRADKTAFLRPLSGKTLLCNCGFKTCHGLTLINEYNTLFHTTALQDVPTPLAPTTYSDDSSDESTNVTDPHLTGTTLSTNVDHHRCSHLWLTHTCTNPLHRPTPTNNAQTCLWHYRRCPWRQLRKPPSCMTWRLDLHKRSWSQGDP